MEKIQTNQRNSRLELLRILCMLMIVAYHYSIYGFYSDDVLFSSNKTLIELLSLGGETGVSVFVLISGYYMVSSRYSFRQEFAFISSRVVSDTVTVPSPLI